MQPGCLQTVLLLKDGVDDDQLLLRAQLQQQAPIVIAVSNAMSTKHSFPGSCVLAHSGIEVAKDYHLIICRGALEEAAKLRVELVFYCRLGYKSWGEYTDECHVTYSLFFKGWRKDLMQSE